MKKGSAYVPFGFGEIFLLTTLRPLAVTSSVTCSPANPGTRPLAMILSVSPGRFGPSRARVGGPVAAPTDAAGSASNRPAPTKVTAIPALRDTTAALCTIGRSLAGGQATSFRRRARTG